ncbi:MAG TPA: aspartate--tRNA ligase [Bacteroidetes bacterium]|nr:aspartate--tRNA ligase [Bacteroidota bacterium]
MYRTHTCGDLRKSDAGRQVVLSGWVQRSRDFGGMTFVDLRDRYGITQLVFNMETDPGLCEKARKLGREFVIRASGRVTERSSKNPRILTGDIEILVEDMEVLNASRVPPFTIEENTDGGDDLRMKYRYLDIRRPPVKDHLILRHRMAQEVRKYLDGQGFIEIETPVLIKSTPEGARDFVVPSRMNRGEFYALPQSPQTFKQLLMVAGMDKYFQIVKCFRDEDLRADRQPEFTQIDCEMSFVEREDVLNTFEGLAGHLFQAILGIQVPAPFPRLSYQETMEKYGTDKPDLRFGMEIHDLSVVARGKGFQVIDGAEYSGGICAPGAAGYSRKLLDELTEFVKRPQIGGRGLIWVKFETDGNIRSSVDKFYTAEDLRKWGECCGARSGDLLLVMSGETQATRYALGELRLEMGDRLSLRDKNRFIPLWVVDFPLLEWDEETGRFYAMHHPFTSPRLEDIDLFESDPAKVRANAYDLVINGVEIGGGSIRIHDERLQKTMFKNLGFSEEAAREQFGFLMQAFRYGAPPHGGIAFGFDRWVALFGGSESIRDFIAFPKNTAGRDVMINTPAPLPGEQLKELGIRVIK